MQEQITREKAKEKIAELRQNFARLKMNCNGLVRISPETIDGYTKQIQLLEAKLN